ncbi:MAG: hypothetical protein PVG39_01300 [Desulfobacteraceae bacterium]|jgi:hypothetical protein
MGNHRGKDCNQEEKKVQLNTPLMKELGINSNKLIKSWAVFILEKNKNGEAKALRKMENMMGTAVLDYFSILGLAAVTEEMMKMNMDDLPYKGEMK